MGFRGKMGKSTGWRRVTEPGFPFRWFLDGRPTGHVATVSWDERFDQANAVVDGPSARLTWSSGRLTITEHVATGRIGTRLQIPLRACVHASITDEPGVPGTAAVRLTLVIKMGGDCDAEVRLRFDGVDRPMLDALVRSIERRSEPAPHHTPGHRRPTPRKQGPTLPRLRVRRVPDDHEWVVFRPMSTTDDVLEPEPRRETP